jgi:penicillin-binding protein 1A
VNDSANATEKDKPSKPRDEVSRFRGAVRKLIFVAAVSSAMVLGALLGIFGNLMRNMPQISELDQYRPRLNTRVFAADTELIESASAQSAVSAKLLAEFTRENRVLAKLSEMPPALPIAFVSIEDQNFYNHHGLDFKAIMRAVIIDIRARAIKQGASTITMQLPRNIDIIGLTKERSWKRKVMEAIMALQIEKKFTKDEILEMYLNQVYLGHRAYGVEAGARAYFGKHVGDLTLAECAMLAGMPQAPSRYDPYGRTPELALERRNHVLRRMRIDGAISEQEYEDTVATSLETGKFERPKRVGDYFIEYVRRSLLDQLDEDVVYAGGLSVKTTLDTRMQKAAEDAVAETLEWYMENRRGRDDSPEEPPQVALVALEPSTGYIRAMVGGRDFQSSVFNRASQGDGRQPGSAFKPIIWATAFEKGYTPADIVYDAPIAYGRLYSDPEREELNVNKLWRPENFEMEYFGDVTLRYALEDSLNICSVKLLQDVGIGNVRANARRLGIESRVDHNLSIAMGTSVLKPVELAAAYATFANRGVYNRPTAILEVTDPDGHELLTHKKESRVAISKGAAYLVTHVLRGVIERGTGSTARDLSKIRPAGGKTGTTDDQRDAWFVGFTPQLACAVWVGYDDNTPLGKTASGLSMTGGRIACPLWTTFMIRALEGEPVLQFEKPVDIMLVDKVRVNADNGRLVPPGVAGRGSKSRPKSEGPYVIEIEDAYIKGTESDEPRRVGVRQHEGRFGVTETPDEEESVTTEEDSVTTETNVQEVG